MRARRSLKAKCSSKTVLPRPSEVRVACVNGEFPKHRTSNGGRSITIDRSEDDESILVFTYAGREVAELHCPEEN